MPGPTVELTVSTDQRSQFVDISENIEDIVRDSGVNDGLCHVYVPHTTAAVTINENADPDVAQDILSTLETWVPHRGNYRHYEGNADSHIKATLVGSSQSVPVQSGRLMLGTWQGIFFCEFDGPRERRVTVHISTTKGW